MPRSLQRRRTTHIGAWLLPLIVLLFTGAILLARFALPAQDPSAAVDEGATPEAVFTEAPATPTPTPFVPAATLPEQRLDDVDLAPAERATVNRVIDGDTIEVNLDGQVTPVRFYGIDAPEVEAADAPDPCGTAAQAQLAALLPAGAEVLLLPDRRDRDRFDRLLRYVFTPDGVSIDAQLIAAGLATAWTSDGTYRRQLKEIETDAELRRQGCLWE